MSIASQCSECCECPEAEVEWDSVSASLTKCGVAVIDDVYYLREVACSGGKLRTSVVDPDTCVLSFTEENDIRCCTTLFESGGKRWATRTTVEDYNGTFYEDSQDPPIGGNERTVIDNTRTGTLTEASTVNADCTTTTTWSGSVYADALITRYYRETEDDPFEIVRTDSDELWFSQSGTGTRLCAWNTLRVTDQSYTGGPITTVTDSGTTCIVIPDGTPPYVPAKSTTVTDTDEVADAPDPEYSDEYTTEMLREKLLDDLPAFDDDWNDTPGSFYNVSTDEASASGRKSRYRLRFKIPKVNTGLCYRLEWVERFIAESGVGVTSVAVYARGVYRPTVTLSAPPSGGTQARAVAVMSSTGTVTNIRVLNPGAGYTSAPTVTVQTAINSGTTSTGWTATLTGGQVTAISGGTAGDYRPTLAFSGGAGSGATATCTVDDTGGIDTVTVTAAGSAYTSAPTLTITPKVSGSVAADLLISLGTETPFCTVWDGVEPGGYDPDDPTTYPILGDGTNPYFEIAVPTTDGTTLVANVRAVCDGSAC